MQRANLFLGIGALLFVSVAVGSCARGKGPGDELLLRTIDSFYAAVEAGDAETRIGLLADDVILMPNHWTRIEGKAWAAEVFRSPGVFRIRDREVLRLEQRGELAYTVNSYEYTVHAAGDQPRWHKTKNVHIWRRGTDGQWKLAVDIWNSDVPLEAVASE